MGGEGEGCVSVVRLVHVCACVHALAFMLLRLCATVCLRVCAREPAIQHSMQSVLWRLCSHIFRRVGIFMLHSLHARSCRWCWQMMAPLCARDVSAEAQGCV